MSNPFILLIVVNRQTEGFGFFKQCLGQMTISGGIFIQIILMIVFCHIEILQWQQFHCQWLSYLLLLCIINGLYNCLVRLIYIIDAGAIWLPLSSPC